MTVWRTCPHASAALVEMVGGTSGGMSGGMFGGMDTVDRFGPMSLSSLTQSEAATRSALLEVQRYDVAVDMTGLLEGEVWSSVSTIAAASRATSVPRPPIAMPMSAARSAGASLTPSPVIATV